MVEKSKSTKSTKASAESPDSGTNNLTHTEIKTVATTAPSKSTSAKSGKVASSKSNKQHKPLKSGKPVKQKMIRDSFTLPENDYANLSLLKAKCLQNGVEVKKSELVRAGLTALTKMTVAALVKAVGEVEKLKTGRPKGE